MTFSGTGRDPDGACGRLRALRTLFSTDTFMARGHSYLWTPSLVVLELVSNALIALGALAIAVMLLRAAGRGATPGARLGRRLLALFALGLAAAHALDVWVIWAPMYGVDVVVRSATAVVAIAAVFVLPRVLHKS
jgi:two-component system sensor histidine kinase/response regulator